MYGDGVARRAPRLFVFVFPLLAVPPRHVVCIECLAFHTDRGSEFGDAAIDGMLEVFGTARSLSKKGCPSGDAVDEPANKPPEAELVWGEEFASLRELQARLNEYVWRHDNDRLHSTLNYMSPVEFRLAGLSL